MHRRAPSPLVAAILALVGLAAPALAQGDGKQGAAPGTQNLALQLRKLCAADSDLYGVLIAAVTTDPEAGTVVLRGFVDKKEQQTILKARADTLIKADAALAKKFGGADVSRMAVVPLRSQYLGKIRAALADDVAGVGARLRLDDVRFNLSGGLALVGLCLERPNQDKADLRLAVSAKVQSLLAALALDAKFQIPDEKPLKLSVTAADLKLLPDPSFDVQRRLVRDARIDDVLLLGARYDRGGALVFDGVSAKGADPKKVIEVAAKAPSTLAVLRPGGAVKAGDFQQVEWDAAAPRLQAAFAAAPEAMARQTRIDRSYLVWTDKHAVQLGLEGVCCDPLLEGGGAAARDQLLVQAARVCEEAAPALGKFFGKRVSTAAVAAVTNPAFDFQKRVAEDLKRDGVVFRAARYDASGRLVLDGFIDKTDDENIKKALAAFFRDGLAAHKALRPGAAEPWSLAELRPTDWGVSPARLQQRFSEGDPLLKQTRVERAYFTYGAKNALQLNLTGVCLDQSLLAGGQAARDVLLVRSGQAALASAGPALAGLFGKNVSTAGIVYVPQPSVVLQPSVAQSTDLDGVRIDRLAHFDAQGRLALDGVWRGPAQGMALVVAVRKKLESMGSPLRNVQLSLAALRQVDTAKLLVGLREWVARSPAFEEVWLQRLYFDAKGALRLGGFAPEGAAAADEKKITEQLRRLLDVHPQRELIDLPPPKTKEVAAVNVLEAALSLMVSGGDGGPMLQPRKSLAAELRKRFHGDSPKSAGTLIDRCYYDAAGVYVVTGLVDRDAQREAVAAAVEQLAAQDEWRALFVKGEKRIDLDRLPLAPMLDALRAVMPAYPELDGLRVSGAYHALDRKLVLKGFQVEGIGDKAEGESRLKGLLVADEALSRRARPGVALLPEPLRRDEAAAALAVSRAAELLRKALPDGLNARAAADPPLPGPPYRGGKGTFPPVPKAVTDACVEALDAALLHAPDDGAAWFLRAMCATARGEAALAGRDLRRLAALEGQSEQAREQRLSKLEHVQGALRVVVGDSADTATFALARGAEPLTLADVRRETASIATSRKSIVFISHALLAARARAVGR